MIGLMVAKAIVVRSAKIIITRKLADRRGRANAEKIKQYVISEIKGAIDVGKFNQFTIRTLQDQNVQAFISNAVLCASSINMSPLDAFQNDVPENMKTTVRKEIHDLLDAVRKKIWSPNGFQKNIYTGGSEFQMSIVDGIRDIIGYVDNATSEIRAFTDSRLTELRKVTECSVLEKFQPPEEIPIGADGYIESIRAALEERGSVTVYGPPGSGKTELCRTFANNYSIQTGRRVVWLTYDGGIESTISNGVRLSDGSRGREMDTVIAEKNLLIVIDDYTSEDAAGNPLERMRCGCKRIYITRDSAVPRNKRSVKIEPPSEEEVAEIVARHMGADDVPCGIMEAVSRYGRNPQMAAMLGEAAAQGRMDLDGLEGILAMDVAIGKDGDHGSSKVSEYLLGMYPLDYLDDESMDVLQRLAAGRSPSDASALEVLLRAGWVKKTMDPESEELSYSLDPILVEMIGLRGRGMMRC